MSKRSEELYLGDMLDYSRRALAKVAGVTREQFDNDEDLQIVVMHHVQIVGEAASKVSAATCDAHPEIPWPEVTGMRHRIVHNYYEIDPVILWNVATTRLPQLVAALERFVPP